MSLFNRPVAGLTFGDLTALLSAGAVENVLLEFKRETPAKDEFLKKASSFANTYGGHLLIGAEASSADARLTALPGVAPEPGLKQRLIQWVYDSVSPPFEIFVSDPIPVHGVSERVCYVFHVPMSAEGPHFLSGRKGCYIRTDEFSQRFEPRPATYSEIEHLADRRRAALLRRETLWSRSVARFDQFAKSHYTLTPNVSGPLGATMMLAIAPSYPTLVLSEPEQLRTLVLGKTVPWRQSGFPISFSARAITVTQHESVLRLYAGGGFSLLECSIWGQLFYALEVEQLTEVDQSSPGVQGISLWPLNGQLLIFLEYARAVLADMPYDGPLTVTLGLARVAGKPFIYVPYTTPEVGPASPFDDQVLIQQATSTQELRDDRDHLASQLLGQLFFALNWPEQAADGAALELQLKRAYAYNGWKWPAPSSGGAAV